MDKKYKKLLVGFSLTAAIISAPTTIFATAFKDVGGSHWAYSAVEWGAGNKITSGYGDGSFKPNNVVTEEEFISMLIRTYEGEQKAASGERWSDPFYKIAKANNYPVGTNRNAKITRQAVAEIIAGTQGKNFTGDNAIKYMLLNGLAGGKTSNTVDGYKGKDTLTRAEALVFIKNVLDKTGSTDLQTRPTTPSDTVELGEDKVPLGGIEVVGDYNAALEAIAKKLSAAVNGLGFSVGYNKSQGKAFVQTPTGGVIMTYSDTTVNSNGTQVVSLDAMLDPKTDTVRPDRLKAVLAAMGAMGLPNGADVKAAITKGLEEDSTTVKSGGVVLEILAVNYGRVVIYVD
ncbi:S-layer homology domain-containing protein [Paenibacillus sp. FSL R5-0744]|uniref:S-layer homology domain-containing protein n=1 Tax=Paenibacillus sp. FSL R5-0744 TaxID=2921656 RepID=UPI0030DAAFFD